jgi:hypothetical protein
MKRLILAFVLFSVVPVFADSFQSGIEALNFDTVNNSAGITVYIHGLSDVHPRQQFFFGNATNVDVLSLTCANQGCTGFNATVALSGLTLNNVIVNGQHFSTVDVHGTLTLAVKFVPSLPFELGQITGTFEACFNPACNDPLFSFFTNTTGKTFLDVNNNAGTLTLASGFFVTPEPTSVALLGTGCLFLIAIAWEKCKRKSVSARLEAC